MQAGGDVREAFTTWVEGGCSATEVGTGECRDDVSSDGSSRPVLWLLGRLWNCSDIMPSYLCHDLAMPGGSSYGAAVQNLIAGTSCLDEAYEKARHRKSA